MHPDTDDERALGIWEHQMVTFPGVLPALADHMLPSLIVLPVERHPRTPLSEFPVQAERDGAMDPPTGLL